MADVVAVDVHVHERESVPSGRSRSAAPGGRRTAHRAARQPCRRWPGAPALRPPRHAGRAGCARCSCGTSPRRPTTPRRRQAMGAIGTSRSIVERVERLQPVAGDDQHDLVVGADDASLDGRPQRGEGHAAGGLGQDALGLGQEADRGDRRPRPRRPRCCRRSLRASSSGRHAVGRAADGQRADDRVGPCHRRDRGRAGRVRRCDRPAAGRLAADVARSRAPRCSPTAASSSNPRASFV